MLRDLISVTNIEDKINRNCVAHANGRYTVVRVETRNTGFLLYDIPSWSLHHEISVEKKLNRLKVQNILDTWMTDD